MVGVYSTKAVLLSTVHYGNKRVVANADKGRAAMQVTASSRYGYHGVWDICRACVNWGATICGEVAFHSSERVGCFHKVWGPSPFQHDPVFVPHTLAEGSGKESRGQLQHGTPWKLSSTVLPQHIPAGQNRQSG